MNGYWWCKHFHLVYLFISVLLHGSFASYSSSSSSSYSSSTDLNGDEPTEEPQENGSRTPSTSIHSTSIDFNTHISDMNISSEASTKINEPSSDERREQDDDVQASARSRSSGTVWKTASRFLQRGIRMFRESLLEGTKVAHMFKEDVDEGMQNIMRQNRGIKKSGGDADQNKSGSGFYDSQLLREGVLGGMLRFMGINSKQMGVIALNVLIILAEWITSSMIGNNEVAGATSRMIKTNLLQWASTGHNAQIERLLTQAKRHTLPEKLIDKLTEKTGNSTSCVQLLICKMSPVIWGFQDTVSDQMKAYGMEEETPWKTAPKTEVPHEDTGNASGGVGEEEPRGFLDISQHIIDKFLSRLPPKDRMVDFGDRCETKFPHCQLLKFGLVDSH